MMKAKSEEVQYLEEGRLIDRSPLSQIQTNKEEFMVNAKAKELQGLKNRIEGSRHCDKLPESHKLQVKQRNNQYSDRHT